MVTVGAASGSVKGTLIVATRDYVIEHSGLEHWLSIIERTTASDRKVLQGLVLVGGWYPVVVFNHLMDEVLRRNGAPYLFRLSRAIANHDLSLVFRLALKFGSPEFVVKRLGTVFNHYFNNATLASEEKQPRHWKVTISGGIRAEEAPGEVVCAIGAEGWVKVALERTGVLTGRLEKTACRFHGALQCAYDLTW